MIYVSYDGIEEPLGRSQVLAYLVRLAREADITLISFEKSRELPNWLRDEVSAAGIEWIPLPYHRRPAVLSTLLDVLRGRRELIRAARRRPPAIIHVRSYVPALMAVSARARTGGRLLFDIRGFWADERVEGGLWRQGGLLYRIAKRCEGRFFAEADAIVTLTQASVPQIQEFTGHRQVAIEVIPTCVDVARFSDRRERPGGPHAVWCGSVGTWYRFDLAATAAEALSLPLTVITRQVQAARQVLGEFPASVRSVAPENVPEELFAGDVGLCLIVSSFSKTASAPTRFAEYLAAGMPVLVTSGIGDLEAIVEARRVGAVIRGDDGRAVARAAEELRALRQDSALSARCRTAARELFDVNRGSAQYAATYRALLTS